ncbi:phosphotransferase family protein [Halorientalis litorea]|jgi:aminoglycoside phosphotransferase (APT) family kinase protein|uniref:phosphotransferase family protein n=1 Tax=Halorientalis litorea TaxID=2931977 RepID=UPI001FF2D94B|nr:phosphotransferase family protein [Halorientalis litorea]
MTDPTAGGASRYVDTEGVYARVAEQLGRAEQWALSPHDAGLGNETLFLLWDGRRFVLRRPPLSAATRDSHDVLREYRVLSALDYTGVPTPRPVLVCRDESVAGAPFTVQERVGGHVLRHGEPVEYAAPDHRRRVGAEMVDALATLHDADHDELDVEASHAGLGARVGAWRERFDRYREATDRAVAGVDDVGDWLAANAPDGERTLVHGDFHLGNVTFSESAPPSLVSVLDWERAGVGDPLTDFGSLLAFWFEDDAERAGLPPSVVPDFTVRSGYHDRAALVDRYEDATGRAFEHDRFYRALAVFEMAAVCEGYYLRHLRGDDREAFATVETAVPELVARARRIIDGAEPL